MLKFFYAVMTAGKTTQLIQAHDIYCRKGYNPVILKKETDTREPHDSDGWGMISSRFYPQKKVAAFYFKDLKKDIIPFLKSRDLFFVDEAQFLTKEEVELLKNLSHMGSVDVITYGLKNSITGELFEGSAALLAHADEIKEIPCFCQEKGCKEKANYHARFVNGVRDLDNNPIKIEQGDVTYKALCYKHYIENVK